MFVIHICLQTGQGVSNVGTRFNFRQGYGISSSDSSEAALLLIFSYFKYATTAYFPILIYLSVINTFPSHSLTLICLRETYSLTKLDFTHTKFQCWSVQLKHFHIYSVCLS